MNNFNVHQQPTAEWRHCSGNVIGMNTGMYSREWRRKRRFGVVVGEVLWHLWRAVEVVVHRRQHTTSTDALPYLHITTHQRSITRSDGSKKMSPLVWRCTKLSTNFYGKVYHHCWSVSCMVQYWTCNPEVAGSNLPRRCCVPTPTQHTIPPESVNEYQWKLGE